MRPSESLGCPTVSGPIDLAGLLMPEGGGEPGGGRGAAPQHQHAAGIAIEAVHEARPLGRLEAEPVQQAVQMLVGGRAALDRESGRLVDDQDLGVAVEHAPAQLRDQPIVGGLALGRPGGGFGLRRRAPARPAAARG